MKKHQNNNSINLFSLMYPRFKIEKPLRLIELFAGYGSQALAFKYLNKPFESYKVVEFDKYAIQSYNEIHGTNYETQDITKLESLDCVNPDKYDYLVFYSFPCTDLSLAGERKGMAKGSGTRSGLLWEVERLLNIEREREQLPKLLIMENVPQVLCEDFKEWQYYLEQLGYQNYTQILDAQDYGIPQHRERCFMVSILGDYYYEFPRTIKLEKKLKDMLEEEVDEKYFISDQMMQYLTGVNQKDSKFPRGERFEQSLENTNNKGIANTITTSSGQRPVDNFIIKNKHLRETLEQNELKNVNDVSYIDAFSRKIRNDNISSTITTRVNASSDTYLLIKNATKTGYLVAEEGDGIDISGRMEYHRGTVQKDKTQTIQTSIDVGVVVKDSMKKELCNDLIESGIAKEGDIIKHSFTGQIMSGDKKAIEKSDNENGKIQPQIEINKEEVSNAITSSFGGKINQIANLNPLRIRKLTPKECLRLMGVRDEDIDKMTVSNAQKYKQAGNSIVVNVLMALFNNLY